ncbi:hypothetical protein Tco_1385856 [Tanacetum coccineum]
MSLRKLGYNVIASLAVLLIGPGGLELSGFVHDPQHVCSRHHLPLSAIMRSHSLLAVTSSGLSSDVSDAGLPLEKVIGLLERLTSQVLLGWSVPWRLPVLGSCQARCWKVIETFLGYALHTIEWNFFFLLFILGKDYLMGAIYF